jgi:hypothetical protein
MSNKSKWEELKDLIAGWSGHPWGWRLKNIENFIDDPVDDIKHKIHGMTIFGKTFYLPRWLMKGSGNPDK